MATGEMRNLHVLPARRVLGHCRVCHREASTRTGVRGVAAAVCQRAVACAERRAPTRCTPHKKNTYNAIMHIHTRRNARVKPPAYAPPPWLENKQIDGANQTTPTLSSTNLSTHSLTHTHTRARSQRLHTCSGSGGGNLRCCGRSRGGDRAGVSSHGADESICVCVYVFGVHERDSELALVRACDVCAVGVRQIRLAHVRAQAL